MVKSNTAKRQHQRKLDLESKGLCIVCTKPTLSSKKMCFSCLQKGREARKSRIFRGLCASCNNPINRTNRKYCDLHLQRQKDMYQLEKIQVYDHYGRQCVCCGEKCQQFLSIYLLAFVLFLFKELSHLDKNLVL